MINYYPFQLYKVDDNNFNIKDHIKEMIWDKYCSIDSDDYERDIIIAIEKFIK